MIESIQNIFKIPELKKRIFFTLGLLTVYRIGGHIPTPGINGEELSKFLHQNAGALMGFFDMFSGGSLSRVTIFALGIMPYISASIILQLLTIVLQHMLWPQPLTHRVLLPPGFPQTVCPHRAFCSVPA